MNLTPDKCVAAPLGDVPHGDDSFRYPGLVRANFSSNVWPFGMMPQLRQYVMDGMDEAASYPPPHAETVTRRLEEYHGLPKGSVLATNGTAEAIYLVAQAYAGAQSFMVVPTFGEYERACRLYGHELHFVGEEAFEQSTLLPEGLWWVCNPNNPTGKIYDTAWLAGLAQSNPQSLFVIDEAYVALSACSVSMEAYVGRLSNVLVLKSLTKSYSVPGIRAGYVLGSPAEVVKLAGFQPPWSVGVPAMRVIDFSIDHRPFSKPELNAYLRSSLQLQHELSDIAGFEVCPSAMGYFLVKTSMNAGLLKERLVRDHGLLVRDASDFRQLDNRHIRLAVQQPLHNRWLLQALKSL